MGSLSQRLHLGVQQKQILTPGLVQMVTVLQLNRLELKDMIMNEIAENPVLEEATDAGEELTPAELQSLLEREARTDPADAAILESTGQREQGDGRDIAIFQSGAEGVELVSLSRDGATRRSIARLSAERVYRHPSWSKNHRSRLSCHRPSRSVTTCSRS